MKGKSAWGGFFVTLLFFALIAGGCGLFGDKHPDLTYSVEVNNQAAGSRAIGAGDKVELYIDNLVYEADTSGRGLILIASGDRDQGSKGGILNNAGWYSVDADLDVKNDVNPGLYSNLTIKISGLRINGKEYPFPPLDGPLSFGERVTTPTPLNENFKGIEITDSAVSLKTVIDEMSENRGRARAYMIERMRKNRV